MGRMWDAAVALSQSPLIATFGVLGVALVLTGLYVQISTARRG